MTKPDSGAAAAPDGVGTEGRGGGGVSVAFLGADGIGKREIVTAVAARCNAEGRPARRVSWQRHLGEQHPTGYPSVDLERMWLDLYRMFFAEAAVGGQQVDVPETFEQLAAHGVLSRLSDLPVTGIRPEAPVTTAWVELAGHTLLQHAVVRPLVAAGTVVLQDSLGVKNVVKSLLMAESGDPASVAALAATRAAVLDYFGRGLAPDLGFHLVGDPSRVLATKGANGIGVFDSLRVFGRDPVRSFLELQERCAAEYAAFATRFGWRQVDIRADGAADREAVVDEIMAVLRSATG
jgi:hypothetical protein